MNLLWSLSDEHTCSFLLHTKPLWRWVKGKSGPTSKRDPWPRHRPTGKCPLYRFEAITQLQYSAVGSNQVPYSCTWQRSLSCETNTGATEEIQALNQSCRGCNQSPDFELAIPMPPSPMSCPEDCQMFVTIVVKHWPLTICLGSVQCYRNVMTNTTKLTHWPLCKTISQTCTMEFLQEVGFFYLIWTVKHTIPLLIWTTPNDLMQFVNFN